MGISISLSKKPYQHPEDIAESKLNLLQEVFSSYKGYFNASRIELWRFAASEALGGEQVDAAKVQNPVSVTDEIGKLWETHKRNWALLESMILRIRGAWNLDHLSLPGLIALNSQEDWRNSYGDIEITSYRKGDIEDLVSVFWKDKETARVFVNGLMDRFAGFEDGSHSLSSILVGSGAPPVQPVTAWLSSYHRTPSNFVSAVISTMREVDPQIRTYFRLVSQSGISGEFYHNPLFRSNLREISQKVNVELDDRSSLKLFGKEETSYGRMLNSLFSFLKPVIIAGIPGDEKIEHDLSAAIARQLGMSLDLQ